MWSAGLRVALSSGWASRCKSTGRVVKSMNRSVAEQRARLRINYQPLEASHNYIRTLHAHQVPSTPSPCSHPPSGVRETSSASPCCLTDHKHGLDGDADRHPDYYAPNLAKEDARRLGQATASTCPCDDIMSEVQDWAADPCPCGILGQAFVM